MCLSYLRTCVLAREVGSGLLLACGSFADPGPILHPAALPIPAHTCPTCRSGRQRVPASLPRSLPPPGFLIRYCQPGADFLPHFPATDEPPFPPFPPFPSPPYLSPGTAVRRQCRTYLVWGQLHTVPVARERLREPCGTGHGCVGKRRSLARLLCRSPPSQGSGVPRSGTYLSPAGGRRGSRRPGARAGRAAARAWRGGDGMGEWTSGRAPL